VIAQSVFHRIPGIDSKRSRFRMTRWDIALDACLLLCVFGCAVMPVPTAVPSTQTPIPVTVRQLIDHTDKYTGHRVSMTGTVVLECTEGCWFFLDDGTGKIYIELKTAGLEIPQKIGSRVILRGRPSGSGGNLLIQAEQVDFPE
jgi:hypothetical protein